MVPFLGTHFFPRFPYTSFPRVHTGGAVELHLANGRTVFPGESTELREEALGVSMKRDSVNDRLVFRSDSVGVDTFETRYNRLEVPRGFRVHSRVAGWEPGSGKLWFGLLFSRAFFSCFPYCLLGGRSLFRGLASGRFAV